MRRLLSVVRTESGEVGRRPWKMARGEEAAARSFYRDLLGGRQVWPTGRRAGRGRLWFLLDGTLVEVGPHRGKASEILELTVESPNEVVERCWDAGYTVRLLGDADIGAMQVIDPFGRTIMLLPRDCQGQLAYAEGV
jgi:hypothetical protein